MRLIAVMNGDKPRSICGLPLMMVENDDGKIVKAKVNLADPNHRHQKPYTKNVPVDLRLIPLGDRNQEFQDWLDFNGFDNCMTSVLTSDVYEDAALVVVLSKNFFPFIHSNEKNAIRSVYYSILCHTDYARYAVHLTSEALKEQGITDPKTQRVLCRYAREAEKAFDSSMPGAQGDVSAVQYTATMLAITAFICHCSVKDILMADYKILGSVANQTFRDIKKDIKAEPDK